MAGRLELDDLQGPFQPKSLYDHIEEWQYEGRKSLFWKNIYGKSL